MKTSDRSRSRFFGLLSRVKATAALAIVAALALLVPVATAGAQSAAESAPAEYDPVHPTGPGAPFLPEPDRVEPILARAEIMIALDQIDLAESALRGRPAVSRTAQILQSQRANFERQLDDLAPQLEALAKATEPHGIAVGAFPVDQLRKMFWDDWHQPRSGGRLHVGTDMLAQIGVPLRAIEDSTFERYSGGGLGGLSVYLEGESGARYFYTHLASAEEFVEGQKIYAGQVVGTNGDSGNARGVPHLHLQVAPDGESGWENPFPLLDALWGEGVALARTPETPSATDQADTPDQP